MTEKADEQRKDFLTCISESFEFITVTERKRKQRTLWTLHRLTSHVSSQGCIPTYTVAMITSYCAASLSLSLNKTQQLSPCRYTAEGLSETTQGQIYNCREPTEVLLTGVHVKQRTETQKTLEKKKNEMGGKDY